MTKSDALHGAATQPRDFSTLLRDVPEGDYAAISPDETEVLAYGPDIEEVRRKAPQGAIIRKSSVAMLLDVPVPL